MEINFTEKQLEMLIQCVDYHQTEQRHSLTRLKNNREHYNKTAIIKSSNELKILNNIKSKLQGVA